MIDKIYDAIDKALEEHVLLGFPYTDQRGRILFHSTKLGCQWTGIVAGDPVTAFVDFGRWLAACDGCGGLEYVTSTDPIPVKTAAFITVTLRRSIHTIFIIL